MNIKIEKMENSFLIGVPGSMVQCTLSDLENLKTHLEYFINNESVEEISVKVGN